MTTLKTRGSRLALFALLLGAVATLPALAGSTVIGTVAGSKDASISGQPLLPSTTIFSGDNLKVGNGVAVIAVGNNDRAIFGRDTVASFLRDASEVTVLLSQGNVSMLHPADGTLLRVKAGGISVTPAAGLRTLGEIALVEGSVVITAKEGVLQVDDHGATKSVATGQTMVISPKTAQGGGAAGATGAASAMMGAAASSAGSVSTAASQAVSAANAATSAAKFIRPGSSRPINVASAATTLTISTATCAPPTLPKGVPSSIVVPLAVTAGPVCPY